jgi:hypothetical protein
MYYDRSGNQNSKTKRDSNALKNAIEVENGVLRMDGTFNVIKSSYYSPRRSVCFCQGYDGRNDPGLVKLTIDTLPCKCLKSYLELTKIKIKTDAKAQNLHKDKSSESLPILLRSMYFTNYSDAFKYLIYRSNF